MILTRMEVRNFKGIDHAVFDQISPNLNLFQGPNESGKSSLVEALHVGLFERAVGRSQSKQDLQTWDGHEAPEVVIDFLDDTGESWRVEKRFLNQPGTVLSGQNVVLRDTEKAEAKLRELFGTSKPGNRGWSDEDLGVWPLLWVRQGLSGTPTAQAMTPAARDALSSTLAAATGATVAGPIGQAVRRLVGEAYAQWFTPTGMEGSALRKAREAAQLADVQLADAHDAYVRAQTLADRLREARRDVARLDTRTAALKAVVEQAEARAQAAAAARTTLDVQEREVKLAAQALEQADRQVGERQRITDTLTQTVTRRATADAHLATSEATHRDATAARDDARTRRAKAEAAEAKARQVQRQVRRRAERDERQKQAGDLKARLDAATGADAELHRLQELLSSQRITPQHLERLEQLVAAHQRAADRVDAASARVRITALADLVVDGQAVGKGDRVERTAAAETSLLLDDLARIEVVPGSGTLDELVDARNKALADLQAALSVHGVPDVAAARTRVEAARQTRLEVQTLEAKKSVLAPDGLAALRTRLDELTEEAEPDATGPLPSRAEADAGLEAAEAELLEARSAVEKVEAHHQAASDTFYTAREQSRSLADAEADLRTRLEALEATEALVAVADAARVEHRDAVARRDAARTAYDEAGGDGATRTLDEERSSLEGLHRQQRTRREDVVRLEGEVAAKQEAGLYDALREAEAEAEAARAAAVRAERDAAVRRALNAAVEGAYQRLQARLAAPVQEVLAETVGILFPGSTLWVRDGDVVGLRTGNVEEQFEQLSGGAREQLGVLVRLGLAQVLAGGRRLPVLLDDALVSSDSDRRGRMVEVLRRAADELQILVFTCHDEDFDRMGDPRRFTVRGRPARSRRALTIRSLDAL